jgi:hypothetical protein
MGATFLSQTYFEDFIYDTANPTGSVEIINATNMAFGNPAGIDPLHPGVFWGDLTIAGSSFALNGLGNTQGFNLGLFATVNLEWMWQLNQAPGGVGFRAIMGPATGNGNGGTTGDLNLVFSIPGTFGGPGTTANIFLQMNNGAGDVFLDTGIAIATLIGGWVKTNFIWNRATGFLSVLINGAQVINTNNAALPTTLTNRRPVFEFNTFQSGVIIAGTRMLFDYIRATYTMNR